MATCEYEVLRQQKIADNRKRMEQLGLQQISQTLVDSSRVRRTAPKPRVPIARSAASADLVRMPARRSTRAQGKPAPNYNESALDLADRITSRKSRQPFLGEVRATSVEEQYTQEDIALLGDYKEPWQVAKCWELFVDGTDASGKRVYDKVNGMTCHQCRQKTLGKHTTCSCCNSLQGVLCGDCLFMRYGENILEVAEKDEWTCPVCRGLCNCSNHRIRRGWAPTGSLYRRAIAEGFRSVAHYLVLTQQVATSTACPTEAAVTEEATTTTVEATHPEQARVPCDQQLCERPQESTATEPQEVVAEEETAGAVPEVVTSTRHSKRQQVQQSIISMMPQSKAGQVAAVTKLNPKKRSQLHEAKQVGLALQGRCTRRKPAVAAA
ncbi:hypothetical protein ABBQ38_006114 [Trebouxia sp. C0009 RCD-2024]